MRLPRIAAAEALADALGFGLLIVGAFAAAGAIGIASAIVGG